MTDKVLVNYHALKDFCAAVYRKCGIAAENAETAAAVLTAADLRGIASHGTARLRRYVDGLKTGQMLPDAVDRIITETDASLVIDAGGGMGAPVSVRTMRRIIEKAGKYGAAFGCVRNSNHFGIAGYYAGMAGNVDMIGIAMTNTAALGVPTFGRHVMFGTNPIAFCAPADKEHSFLLDMSTTVVSRGKIEVYAAAGKPLPYDWAVDRSGKSATDAQAILNDMLHRYGGGILPLGGEGEQFGGYKGYGLAVMVDILCAVLCGAPFGPDICDTELSSARVGHFFGAVRLDLFRDSGAFKRDMDRMIKQLRESEPAEGCERVYVAGQKEREQETRNLRDGVPLANTTMDKLCEIAAEFDLEQPNNRCEREKTLTAN
ncbi:MAG: Ldh family oxidoreductase [Victivallales bacterium]|nr:Ldh family oxidoreductase [Victivallales bacterium]